VSLSKLKCICIDLGLFTENAVRIAKDVAEFWYYIPCEEAFPEPFKSKIGKGLEGIERIRHWGKYVDKADFVVFFDSQFGDWMENWKERYAVAGPGLAEKLELDRWHGRMRQKENGLPVQETERVIGVTNLRKFTKDHKNYWIKVDNEWRGICESFETKDQHYAESRIYWITYKASPFKEDIIFICEERLPGVEPGVDGITWEGELVFPTTVGYERRGSGIITRVYQTEKELPEAVKWIDSGLAPEFKKHKTRFFYSAEFKIGPDKIPYLIDPTIRLAAPGVAAIQTELIENYSEVVYGMATGVKVAPVMEHKYAAAVSMESSEAAKTFVNISFPKSLRQWVKLRMAVKKGNDYYSVPPFDSLGTVIGFGDTVKEAVDLVKERVKQVEAISINTDLGGLDQIVADIQTGKTVEINF
jgi:hypothetical protein